MRQNPLLRIKEMEADLKHARSRAYMLEVQQRTEQVRAPRDSGIETLNKLADAYKTVGELRIHIDALKAQIEAVTKGQVMPVCTVCGFAELYCKCRSQIDTLRKERDIARRHFRADIQKKAIDMASGEDETTAALASLESDGTFKILEVVATKVQFEELKTRLDSQARRIATLDTKQFGFRGEINTALREIDERLDTTEAQISGLNTKHSEAVSENMERWTTMRMLSDQGAKSANRLDVIEKLSEQWEKNTNRLNDLTETVDAIVEQIEMEKE